MKVSLNHVKNYIDIELPPVDELVDRINRQLGGVEEVIDLASRYKDARIVTVAKCEKHPDADRLSVCMVDDNGAVEGVERDEYGLVQVVCGAPNVRGGMTAVWLPPKSVVPASADDDEPFVLSARELRGVMSQGMLAAPDELAIGDGHDGIVEITERDLPQGATFDDQLIGRSFGEVFGLDDTIIDIENKMFTHRPDLFGQLGVAREIYAILGGVTPADEGALDVHFKNPELYQRLPHFEEADKLKLDVFNDAIDKVPRVMFVAMSGIEVGSSPLWLQCALVAMGSKAINNIVDATNYIMLTTAQPTHAYDYDKIRGYKIGARMARDGEKITLLNGKEYELTSDDIVIADGDRPIGLAGIMGGSDTEVDENTKNIILEVATFDMYAVRKSSMRHGLFTDALTRFNKGQSPIQNSRVLAMLMENITNLTDASQASSVYDLPRDKWALAESVHGDIHVTRDFINQRLGLDLTVTQIGNLLRRANIVSWPDDNDSDTLVVTAPFWRTDISLPEDIVEEVGRLYDFGKLPRALPERSIAPVSKSPLVQIKQDVRTILSRAGANEVLTYSFVHKDSLEKVGQSAERAYQLSNALSPDLHYMRLSLQPSLLDKIYSNIRDGHDKFAIFEIGKVHDKSGQIDEDGLPVEPSRLALSYVNKSKQSGSPYYDTKRLLDFLFEELNIDVTYVNGDSEDDNIGVIFESKRRAVLVERVSGQQIGVIGEYSSSVKKAYKLPESSAGFEINLDLIADQSDKKEIYQALSRYPSTERDVCFKLADDIQYQTLIDETNIYLGQSSINYTIEPVDIYQAEGDDTKNITIRIKLTPYERTLKGEEIDQIVNGASIQVCQKLHAEIV